MKLDPTVMRTMSRTDFRVLQAVETGMQNHALVPAALISTVANLRHGGCHKFLSSLLRDKLLSHDRSCGYDGYRLTNSGYDILALHNLKTRGIIAAIGDRIGTGKESDVYLAANSEGKQVVLKLHRLGRTSFRAVKKKRDYFQLNSKGKNAKHLPNSWLFLSRISALKEFAFMKALYSVGYTTPNPIGHNRHIVAMSLIRGVPLYQLHTNRVSALQAESIFTQSIGMAVRLARHGLVHCDLNEFNLMVDMSGGVQTQAAGDDDVATHYVRHSGMSVEMPGLLSAHTPLESYIQDGTGEIVTEAPPKPLELLKDGEPNPVVTLIDFPQMVSTRHPNAEELFMRDIECLKRFFTMKLKCMPENDDWQGHIPSWENLVGSTATTSNSTNYNDGGVDLDEKGETLANRMQLRLDEELQASGYSEEDRKRDVELHYHTSIGQEGEENSSSEDEDEMSEDDKDDSRHEYHEAEKMDNTDTSFANTASNANTKPPTSIEEEEEEDEETKLQRKWERAETKARERVRRHLEDDKKNQRKKNAFKSRNANKTFVKGKRVMNNLGY